MEDPTKLLVLLSDPQSVIAESYRGVRTSLQRALSNGVRTVMFVSTFGGDGKSMVCANVAVALSQLFLEVVLVDCDLRKPTTTNLFDALDKPGLSDFLAGSAQMDQILYPGGVDRLRIVPSGTIHTNAADLLGRPSLGAFCKQVADKCDVVLFDTSPLSACSDALSLGTHIDTTVMVVNPRQWDGDVEVKARQSLEAHNIPVMGLILNGTDPGDGYGYGYGYGGYGARGYGYGYGYGYGVKEGAPLPEASRDRPQKVSLWKRVAGWFGD